MAHRFTFRNFLKDLGMRIGAAATVIGVFFGLAYVGRADFLGLSDVLSSQLSFFAAAFLSISFLSVGWIVFQCYRS